MLFLHNPIEITGNIRVEHNNQAYWTARDNELMLNESVVGLDVED